MIAQAARALGAGPAIIVDMYDTPLQCARELGLGPCFNMCEGGEEALAAEIAECGAVGAVFDTTGDARTQRLGLGLLDRGGTMVLMAGAAEGLAVGAADLAGERRLMTCSNHRHEDFGIGLSMLTEGRVVLGPMITHRFELEDATKAFEVAADKVHTGAMKVILIP